MDTAVEQRLADLLAGRHTTTGDSLDAGAQLVVSDPGGSEVFRAALARHYRTDPADQALIWIRPVIGGAPAAAGEGRAFNLSLARRRSLSVVSAQLTAEGGILLGLASGQTACITPAEGAELDELRHWDDFTLRAMTPEEEAALDALDADSWHGRFG